MNPYSTPRAFVVRVQSIEDPAPNAPEWYVCTAQEVVESDLEPVRTLGRQGTSGEDGREPYQAVTEAMGSVLPDPDEDGPAPELGPAELWLVCVINFGHDEYPPKDAGGLLRWETLWDPHAEELDYVWRNDEDADAELLKLANATGVMLDEAEVGWSRTCTG
jgi:hypothetical protein